MSQLFRATQKATRSEELRTYYSHNCVYGKASGTNRFTEPMWVDDLMRVSGAAPQADPGE